MANPAGWQEQCRAVNLPAERGMVGSKLDKQRFYTPVLYCENIGKMIRVLCVDDDALSLDLAKAFLEDSGEMTLDTAISGPEALNMMAAKRYDAIISDYGMPSMDGLELLRRVRYRDADIPFILFTGRGREEVVIDACNAGITFYVRKGADVKTQFFELDHKVKQAVARRRAEDNIRTAKQQDRMAMDLARIARWEFDLSLGLLRFDDMFYELCGTSAEREGGYIWDVDDYLRELVHPDDRELVSHIASIGLETLPVDGYMQTKHRIIRRDGKTRNLLVRVGKVVDGDGNVVKVVGISMDITED